MLRTARCALVHAAALAIVLLAGRAAAQPVAPAFPVTGEVQTVVITGERAAGLHDLPLSADVIGPVQIQSQRPHIDLSESLAGVPGLVVQNRQNQAQDLQISSRGFGARSTFGVRGLRFFVDGIPATLPDGQAQVSHIDLASAGRIEVLRGPFSVLYGNAAGGVVAVFTEESDTPSVQAESYLGAFGWRRGGFKALGASGDLHYTLSGGRLTSEGYRAHSAAQRSNGNARLRFAFSERTQLTLVANTMQLAAEDPLGLTHAQFDADPRQADPSALRFDTRKRVDQTQFGVVVEHTVSEADRWRWMMYAGDRAAVQFQAIPVGAQSPPTSTGGVIDLDRGYGGADLRWTHSSEQREQPWRLVLGLATDRLHEVRRGYENFIDSTLGVQGALRRDEVNRADNLDPYAQLEWEPSGAWLWMAGVRGSRVVMRSDDHFVTAGNGDDSGAVTYRHVNPVLGVTWRATPKLAWHASVGQGFETPTLSELAYRSSSGGETGMNLALQAASSQHVELGLKARWSDVASAQVTAFGVRTQHELAVLSNNGGRTVYQNAGRTLRAGVEAQAQARWANGVGLRASFATLHAVYLDAFCNGDCASGTVPAGNRLPGTPSETASVELSWQRALSAALRWDAAIEARQQGRVFVDDRNSDSAPPYALVHLRAGLIESVGPWTLQAYTRVDNLTDRRYAGSVIVNESKGRFFEPGVGRAVAVGVSAAWRW